MSKCEIKIEFDRLDRTYRGGETVRGVVRISVQEDVNSKGIKLTHRWRTHGRGNTDSGPEETIQLSGPQVLVAGEQMEFAFAMAAPTQPVTYRGQLISIDHYIRVDVEVPWARDPWVEEEYILNPGAPPPQMTGQRDSRTSLKVEPAASSSWMGQAIGGIIVSIVLAVLAYVLVSAACCLFPIILIVGGFFWIRHKALAARLGTVELSIPHLMVGPGEEWPVSIRFRPRKSFSINSITLRLEGQEIATSGSGTNATTHTHKLLSESHVIREGGPLAAGETVDETVSITFPNTEAFSFDEPSNKIKWNAQIRIDIPRFPDWSRAEEIQVVPIEFFGTGENLPNAEPGETDSMASRSPETAFAAAITEGNEYPNSSADQDDSANVESSLSVPGTIEEFIAQLDSAGRDNRKRAAIFATASQTPFMVSILIDRIASSIGTMNVDERHANGKTVIGTIEGTRQTIQVVTTEDHNHELEGYRRGEVWQAQVTVLAWDSLYNRITAQQVG